MKMLSTLARDRIRALIDDYGNSNCREIYDEGPDVSYEKSDDSGSTSSTVSVSGMYDNIQARARAHPSSREVFLILLEQQLLHVPSRHRRY